MKFLRLELYFIINDETLFLCQITKTSSVVLYFLTLTLSVYEMHMHLFTV